MAPGTGSAGTSFASEHQIRSGLLAPNCSDSAAQDCCLRGNLTYPVVKAQPSASLSAWGVALLAVMAHHDFSAVTMPSGASAHTIHAPPLLLIALYQLDSAYRI